MKVTLVVPGADFVTLRKVSVYHPGATEGDGIVLLDKSLLTDAGQANNLVYVPGVDGDDESGTSGKHSSLHTTASIAVNPFTGVPALPNGVSDHSTFTEFHIAPLVINAPNYPVFLAGTSYAIENVVAITPQGGGKRVLASITQKRVTLRSMALKGRALGPDSRRGIGIVHLSVAGAQASNSSSSSSVGAAEVPSPSPSVQGSSAPAGNNAVSSDTQSSGPASSAQTLIVGVCASAFTVLAGVIVAVKIRQRRGASNK